jgi:hypothetical protein
LSQGIHRVTRSRSWSECAWYTLSPGTLPGTTWITVLCGYGRCCIYRRSRLIKGLHCACLSGVACGHQIDQPGSVLAIRHGHHPASCRPARGAAAWSRAVVLLARGGPYGGNGRRRSAPTPSEISTKTARPSAAPSSGTSSVASSAALSAPYGYA